MMTDLSTEIASEPLLDADRGSTPFISVCMKRDVSWFG